jgi:lambda family phage portal protein
MSLIEKAILAVSPGWAKRRARDRAFVAYYEAAQPSRLRPGHREAASGNQAVLRAGRALREQARHLEQNHDLARGVLDVLVRNTVGAGISVEPQPRMLGQRAEIADDLAYQMSRLWQDYCRRPEVTWQHDMGSAERIMARTWFRDGEVLAQRVMGASQFLAHGTKAPYSIEMLEPDYLPLDHNRLPGNGLNAITMGVEVNGWNRPIGYWLHKRHPGDAAMLSMLSDLKRLPAEAVLHLKSIDRIGQLRGVSVFASVLGRLEDIKDYEESERVAAKVAASMAAMIIKGQPDDYVAPQDGNERTMRFRAGTVFDDLRPGESVQTIDTKRPNPNALLWRQGQLRAVASGVGTSYSSAAKDYNGTYSAQRQELVEQWGAYQILMSEFISRITRPIYEDFVSAVQLARLVQIPPGVDPESLKDALFIGPQMPWIDPKKEAESWALLEDRSYASGPEIVRRRGGNPWDTLDQQGKWVRMKEEAGVKPPPVAPAQEEEEE